MIPHPFTNIPPDDADHLLYMVEQAHRPFTERPLSIGDIADQWIRRYQRSQPKSKFSVANSLNPRIAALQAAYAPRQESQPDPSTFTFEQACSAIQSRWPGLQMGEPERAWAQQPVIRELHQLRSEVQRVDTSRATITVREMTR